MNLRRVVITGMGAITPLGSSVDIFWENLKAGRSGISKIERFDTSDSAAKIAGEIKNFVAEDYMDKKLASRMDRFSQFGVAALKEAVESSRLNSESIDKQRVGVVLGSGIGGLDTLQENAFNLINKGARRVSPMFIPGSILDIVSGYAAMIYGFTNANYAVTSACATGVHSLIAGFNHIRLGDADVMIAGAAESALTSLGVIGFVQARALSTHFNHEPEKASRPFDIDRDGFVMSEGAGILVLEEYEHALKRNVPILGEIISYGATADAYHITAPHPEGIGAGSAMKQALQRANLQPKDIDLINMHGTSTPLGDIAETKAIKVAFGEQAYHVHCNSTKSMLGHSLGAAGALESIAIMKMMEQSCIHPTINLDNQDPECDLNYTPNVAQVKDINIAMNNSFGFGGHNVSVIFKKL
ncbi:MAG: beta-ketoacyl-ACP synthase II [Brevinemataceae bacterium]